MEAEGSGLLQFIRYGFAPNLLSYCGPRDSKAIQDYLKAGRVDQGLKELMVEYTGALPHLRFIARQNQIKDPFDRKVVEAYWIGNGLLERCDLREFYDEIYQRFRKRVSPKSLKLLLGPIPQGARPHHSFHVLQRGAFEPGLKTINNCLIRVGEIKSSKNEELKIKTKKLKMEKGELKLAPSVETVRALDGSKYKNGDWVSLHWGWMCEKITSAQKRQLDRWTEWNLQRIKI
jgi:hypothetical protein